MTDYNEMTREELITRLAASEALIRQLEDQIKLLNDRIFGKKN